MDWATEQARRKSAMRRSLSGIRAQIPPAERLRRSRLIAAACADLPGFSSAGIVCTYISFRDEVDTTELIGSLLRDGRRVAVPVHSHGTVEPLDFAEIESLDGLPLSHFGVPQPARHGARYVPTEAIPLYLVPGLAFDTAGRRLGYGLGFYDRAFAAAAPGAIKVGLAFDAQIVERVPADPHDVRMDVVVTEDRVIPAAGGGSPTRRC